MKRITQNQRSNLLSLLFALSSVLLFSCEQENIVPDTPEQPTPGYRLTFDGGVGVENQTRAHWSDLQGSGNLIFNWDYNSDEETTNEMVMAFYKEKFIASTTGNYHTYASIHRHSDPEKQQDNHYASFTTVEKYDSPLSSGDYEDCRVVALTPLRADNDTYIYSLESRVIANLPMPGTFEQNDDQEPDFLSNYMYMYADASITDGTAFLLFEHIPATFRFKITNKRPEPARINSVKVTVVDTEGVEQPVASQFVDVLAASDEDIVLSYPTSTYYTEVTTNINTDLATDEKYTAYALVLPLYGNAPLEGKKIRFTIDASNPDNEYLSFELDAETLANANHGEYNWVGGKSYTINMRLGDVLYFDGVTVADWNKETVEGGEAEEAEEAEWRNGINIYTGEYEPATLNAEGAYEIANAGNLMWMSEQIGARTIGIPYTIKLVEDVTIGEDLKWIPIAHPDGTQNSSVFDGNGHTLTINQNCQDASESNFGIYASFNYSVIKNLTINGDVVINTPSAVGVVAGTAYRTTISCVTSYANITNLGTGRVGGLVGQFGGQHSGDKYSLIENCSVYANISGTIAGGIVGYGWAGWQYYDIKNTAFYGDVTGTTHQGAIIGYHANNQTATKCTFQHIYYYEKDGIAFSGGGNTNYTLGADVIAKTPAEFASVTMAELLNADQENAPWEYVTGNDYPTLKKN